MTNLQKIKKSARTVLKVQIPAITTTLIDKVIDENVIVPQEHKSSKPKHLLLTHQ